MMITEAIVMLGLLDKSDIAWKNERYYGVWNMMQTEYEMSARFEAVDKKVGLSFYCFRLSLCSNADNIDPRECKTLSANPSRQQI